MTLKKLCEILDIEGPEDLEFFEQLADLMETEGHISAENFAYVLSELSPQTAEEFVETYIEELEQALPEGEGDGIIEALDAMQHRLILLAEELDDEDSRSDFCDELYKLREWLHEEGGTVMDSKPATMLEAFTEMRAEKLGATAHRYDLDIFAELMPEEISYKLGKFSKIDI